MALNGNFVINDADYSPLTIYGVGTFLAFSGNGAYRNRGGCVSRPQAGPVAPGRYWVVERPSGGIKSKFRAGVADLVNSAVNGATFKHSDWFALYRDDWNIDDEVWVEHVKRGHFRLHPGVLSEGCITLPHESDFACIRNALLRTKKIAVPCMKNLMAFGMIEVVAYGKKCP